MDEITSAIPDLHDRPMDPMAQERMRRALEPARLGAANESASRVIQLRLPGEKD